MSCVLGLWPMSLNMVQRLTSTETARTAHKLTHVHTPCSAFHDNSRGARISTKPNMCHMPNTAYIYTHIQLSSTICMGIYDIYIIIYIYMILYIYIYVCSKRERESSAGLRAALIHAAQPTAYNVCSVHSVCIEHNVHVVVQRLESPRHGNTQPQYMSCHSTGTQVVREQHMFACSAQTTRPETEQICPLGK